VYVVSTPAPAARPKCELEPENIPKNTIRRKIQLQKMKKQKLKSEKCPRRPTSQIARRRRTAPVAESRFSAPRVGSVRSKHEAGRPREAFDSLSGLSRARSLSLSRTRRARGAQPLTSIRSAERSQTQSHASHVSDASSEESPSGRYRTRIGCRLSLARSRLSRPSARARSCLASTAWTPWSRVTPASGRVGSGVGVASRTVVQKLGCGAGRTAHVRQ